MATYYLPEAALRKLLEGREDTLLFAPAETSGFTWLSTVDSEVSLEALAQPRSAQSPKGFFLPATESVGRYGPAGEAATAVELGGTFEDPAYRERREAVTVISCDCVSCAETCFCTLVGGKPYPQTGYDVNLTPLDGGYVAEVATEAGEKWLGDPKAVGAEDTNPQQLAHRDEIRKEMVRRVSEQNASFTFTVEDDKPTPLPNDGEESWQRFAADCVECAACTNICPTCHCFYLYDQALGPEAFERIRTWDSCLLSSYHRMAGGVHMKLTPRPKLFSRLANRILHKFTYSPEQYEQLGCVGCGRCVDACLGAIDIRQVVQELGQ